MFKFSRARMIGRPPGGAPPFDGAEPAISAASLFARREQGYAVAMGADRPLRHVLFEFVRVGNSIKVCAIDPETNTEISIVGDPAAGEERLKLIAVRKLEYVLAKRKGTATT
jgi:hypothetical protein